MLSRRFGLSLICLSVEIVVGLNASCISEDLIRTLIATKGSCKNDIKQGNVDKPAFFAFLRSDLTSSGTQVIKFQDVRINVGNHYNPTTGMFTAPRPGIYQISCTIVGFKTSVFWYQITVNGSPYTLGNTSRGDSWNSQTSTVLIDLKKGDRVYVEHRGGSQTVHANTNTYFSGYLLQ
uniref:Putative C1q domain containing protein MgC1q30 n=1 Tax=Mytilus galloprovincialis TaxID=29158 RepID=F0V467_MYTGA|nr:putative C1q domain containing protein MgC1q30 [Mytilus galloprovincialis]